MNVEWEATDKRHVWEAGGGGDGVGGMVFTVDY